MLPLTSQIVMMQASHCIAGEFGGSNGCSSVVASGVEGGGMLKQRMSNGEVDVVQEDDRMELIRSACKNILLYLSEAIKTHHRKNNPPKTISNKP